MENGHLFTPQSLQPMNLHEDKSQSQPAFYKRPPSPPALTFKDAFHSNNNPSLSYSRRKFHPYLKTDISPVDKLNSSKYTPINTKSKTSQHEISQDVNDSTKKRSLFGGLFRRWRKEHSSSSSDNEREEKKSQGKDKKRGSIVNNYKNEQAKNSALSPNQCYQTNYVVKTASGKVIKMSPTGSLGNERSTRYIGQPLGVPPLTAFTPSILGKSGVSLSHDSLAPSAASWNSESAYGSINSSIRSGHLGRCSSTDAINKKDKKALKARVEKLREKAAGSSSDEDVGSIDSSQFGSESSLNKLDSVHSRTRHSRTERYIRRKAQELETLKVESEKDRRNKAIVQARILEIQKSQRNKSSKNNLTNTSCVYIDKNDTNNHFTRSLPLNSSTLNSSSLLSAQPYSPAISSTLFSHAHRSVSYDSNIHQRPFLRNRKPIYINNEDNIPPAPPPRDRRCVGSPLGLHRPTSYSFEHLNREQIPSLKNINNFTPGRRSFYKVPSPYTSSQATSCCSPIPHNGGLPPVLPYRRTCSEKQLTDIHIPSSVTSSSKEIYRPVHQHYTNEKWHSKTIPMSAMPPSPSSDYSSYISDNSSRVSQNQPSSLPLELEMVPVSAHCVTVSPQICTTISTNPVQSSQALQSQNLDSKLLLQNQQSHICDKTDRTSPIRKIVPEPPKRNSSSLSKTTGEYLRKHLELLNTLGKSEIETQELQKKVEEAFTNERKRLQKSKCANFEEALKELEAIYQSLNLNSEDVMDGAEKRDSGAIIDAQTDEMNIQRKNSPDKIADDFHYRKFYVNNNYKSDAKSVVESLGSYMLVSPVHVPPYNAESVNSDEQVKGKKEPNVICDDVTYRNAQRANVLKVLDPQPPFGIPIGPITQCSDSDYLHSDPACAIPPSSKKEPNTQTVRLLAFFQKMWY